MRFLRVLDVSGSMNDHKDEVAAIDPDLVVINGEVHDAKTFPKEGWFAGGGTFFWKPLLDEYSDFRLTIYTDESGAWSLKRQGEIPLGWTVVVLGGET